MTFADTIMEHVQAQPLPDQLSFWEKFRTAHRTRTANGEAQLQPDLLRAVDATILKLKRAIAQGG